MLLLSDLLQFSGIQNNRKRSVIDEGDFHICTESPSFYDRYLGLTGLNDIFIQLLCFFWIAGLNKAWPVSFLTI